MTKDELKARTKLFAHNCVKLALDLPKNILGRHIESQLIRSSTSVAANYRAACKTQISVNLTTKFFIGISTIYLFYLTKQWFLWESMPLAYFIPKGILFFMCSCFLQICHPAGIKISNPVRD